MRLKVAVGGAIPHPAPAAPELAAAASIPAPSAPPTSPLRGTPPQDSALGVDETPDPEDAPVAEPAAASPRRGGWLSSLLRRPAGYLRAYLTASIEHQLQTQARREADLWGAARRVERRTEHLAAQAHAAAIGLDHALAHLEAVAVAVARLQHHLSDRLDEVERRQDRVALGVGKLAVDVSGLAVDTNARAAGSAAAITDQLTLARRAVAAGDHAVNRLDEVLGVLGPRFDELDIKVRPLIEVDDQSTAVRTADGYIMLPRSEPLFVTAVANASSGGLEPGTRRVLRALLRSGDACADVGANVGLLTVAMAFAVGASGCVWAFEPEARVRAQLERTLHLNGLHQVALSGAAVGAQSGRLTFNQSPIIGHSSLYPLPDGEQAQARPVQVEVVRLDDVVPRGVALAAVKIDVEGAELDVLRGMARIAADSPDLAVVAEFGPSHLTRVGVSPADWFAAFAAHGLEPRLIAEPFGVVSPVAAADLTGVESANLVFVRPGGAADARLPR